MNTDDSGKLKSDWYSKPIASNRLINYYSAHPRNTLNRVLRNHAKEKRLSYLYHSNTVNTITAFDCEYTCLVDETCNIFLKR